VTSWFDMVTAATRVSIAHGPTTENPIHSSTQGSIPRGVRHPLNTRSTTTLGLLDAYLNRQELVVSRRKWCCLSSVNLEDEQSATNPSHTSLDHR
jgi:hypothetical protein